MIQYSFDGVIKGRPVEVRAVKKDHRFRIQQDVHRQLVANQGSYIFVNSAGRSKRVSARQVSARIGRGQWFKDRTYPHKFLMVDEVFK